MRVPSSRLSGCNDSMKESGENDGKTTKVGAVTESGLPGRLTCEVEFVCAGCGAKSHKKRNVCDPVPVEADH